MKLYIFFKTSIFNDDDIFYNYNDTDSLNIRISDNKNIFINKTLCINLIFDFKYDEIYHNLFLKRKHDFKNLYILKFYILQYIFK